MNNTPETDKAEKSSLGMYGPIVEHARDLETRLHKLQIEIEKHNRYRLSEIERQNKDLASIAMLRAALIRLRDLDINCTQQEDAAAWGQAHNALTATQ